jgi:SHS2 domain-containing protein
MACTVCHARDAESPKRSPLAQIGPHPYRFRLVAMSWVFAEHTGEVELRLYAPSLSALLSEAGQALAALMLGEDVDPAREDVHEQVRVTAPDREALLVTWLDEIVYLSETRRAVFTRFEVSAANESAAEATIYGVTAPVLKTAVKAATYHRLQIKETAAGLEATVVLDV